MSSPLPGMNPYLEEESLWPSFQHQLVQCLYQKLLPGLIDRYRARVCQRHYLIEQILFTSVTREERQEEYIEIRQRSDNRLITLLEVVSPSNKTSQQGRTAYLDKRRECRANNASLVEIDLILQGQPLIDYPREGLPDWDYAVTVTRSTQPDRYEIYTATLQKRLPRFRMPLAADDRDTVVDLQLAFNQAFDQGNFSAQIDYRRDPRTRLDDDDRRWLDDWLKQHKYR
jgi:hypothetical protein